jgi:hypothetical protein
MEPQTEYGDASDFADDDYPPVCTDPRRIDQAGAQ